MTEMRNATRCLCFAAFLFTTNTAFSEILDCEITKDDPSVPETAVTRCDGFCQDVGSPEEHDKGTTYMVEFIDDGDHHQYLCTWNYAKTGGSMYDGVGEVGHHDEG
ncbi:MAG: hypothetical protein ABW088_16830 [Sedimenticola sp.]